MPKKKDMEKDVIKDTENIVEKDAEICVGENEKRDDETEMKLNELRRREILRMSNAESKELTRDCIRTAFLCLLKNKSFQDISVSEIIRRSGVSRSGFYRNYTGKEEVLEDISSNILMIFDDSVRKANYRVNTEQWYTQLFIQIRNHAEMYQMLIQSNVSRELILSFENTLKDYFKIETSRERYAFIALCRSIEEITIEWFCGNMKETPEEMGKMMVEMFRPITENIHNQINIEEASKS